MQTRMWKLTSGLALILFSFGLGGCQLFSGENASEANASASDKPDVVQAEQVSQKPATDAPVKAEKVKEPIIATTTLTSPTDPDARVKAIKKGRSNPFAHLTAPSAPSGEFSGQTGSSDIEVRRSAVSSRVPNSRSALTSNSSRASKPVNNRSAITKAPDNSTSSSSKSKGLPRLENPTEGGQNGIVLPPLPEATLAKQVSVQGVVNMGGQPKAILKAPNESVARTVQAGDYLSNGQILVAAIDVSNPQNPMVILQESGQTVTVGVGKGADTMTAALPF